MPFRGILGNTGQFSLLNHMDVQVLWYQKKSKQRNKMKSEESDKILTMLHHIKFLQEEGSLDAARDTAAWILAKNLLRASRANDLARSAHNKANIIKFCKENIANFFCYSEFVVFFQLKNGLSAVSVEFWGFWHKSWSRARDAWQTDGR